MTSLEAITEPLLEELELDYEGLHVVALGGGHGLAQALMAIQGYADVITAIVGVADDGGSSGRLAPAHGIPPPGDIRRALLALSPQPSLWRQLVAHRFTEGDVAGHSLGNLLITAMAEMFGSFEDALHSMGRLIGARGAVIPASPERLGLEATIDDHRVVGQAVVSHTVGTLTDLRLVPDDAPATRAALDAIRSADQIVIGPGSLFTSLIACLKVGAIAETVSNAPAQLVYVLNLSTQDAETLGLDAEDHVSELVDRTGLRTPDVIVANDGAVAFPTPISPLRPDPQQIDAMGCRLELADLVDRGGDWPQHDPARLGAVLRRLA